MDPYSGRNPTRVSFSAPTSGATSSPRCPEVAWPNCTAASGSSSSQSSSTSEQPSSVRSAPRPGSSTSSWWGSWWASAEVWPSRPWTSWWPSGLPSRRGRRCLLSFTEVSHPIRNCVKSFFLPMHIVIDFLIDDCHFRPTFLEVSHPILRFLI